MGTYTTNYNLFMPSVGETGWGELVNSNFSTIDLIMGGLTTRLTAVENEVNGNLSCTSVTTSEKITANGVINANAGIDGKINLYESGSTSTVLQTMSMDEQTGWISADNIGTQYIAIEEMVENIVTVSTKSTAFNIFKNNFTFYLFCKAGYGNNVALGYGVIQVYIDDVLVGEYDANAFNDMSYGNRLCTASLDSNLKIVYKVIQLTSNSSIYWSLKPRTESFYL